MCQTVKQLWLAMCRQSYNLHPYVKAGVLTLALNGTLTSTDLVNVTITVSRMSTCCMGIRCCGNLLGRL
jgi:hypothetical protein